MNLGERYRKLRASVKDESGNPISVKDFAAKCVKLQAPRISELENNKREMSLTELKAYHEYFKVSFEYLLGETDVKTVNDKVQTAIEVTGLSEEVINKLIDFKNSYENIKSRTLSLFLATDIWSDLISNLWLLGQKKLYQVYTGKMKNVFSSIGKNSDFSFNLKKEFILRYAENFGYLESADEMRTSIEIKKMAESISKNDEALLASPDFDFFQAYTDVEKESMDSLELEEYKITKKLHKVITDFLFRVEEEEYGLFQEEITESFLSFYAKDGYHALYHALTEEEQRFGEYIRNLFEEEAEQDGKHQ